MSLSNNQHSISQALQFFMIASLVIGCAQAQMESSDSLTGPVSSQSNSGLNTETVVNGSISSCELIQLDEPLADSILNSTQVQVSGSVVAKDGVIPEFIGIDQEMIPVINGRFDTTVHRLSGSHTMVVNCVDYEVERVFKVEPGSIRIVVTSPETATFVSSNSADISVSGYIENYQMGTTLTLNNMPITLDANGQFHTRYDPYNGLNHLDFVASIDTQEVDTRHSILYGQLNPFGDESQSKLAVDIRQTAFDKLSTAIEQHLSDDLLEDMIEPYMGRNGDIELHEIRYDKLEVDFMPDHDRIRVRLRIHDFGIKVTYHYFAGRIRGWANVDTAEVEVDLKMRLSSDGKYDLELEDPSVDLDGFDLDLDDIYSIAEGLVQPLVLDLGRDALIDVLDTLVIEELLNADLLNQPLDLLGHQTTMKLALTELKLAPEGVTALANAGVDPFPPVKELPGIWTAGSNTISEGGNGDAIARMSVDIFNRLAAHAVRGGLLDQDLAELLGEDESIASRLSIAVLATLTQSDLLSTFSATAPVHIRTEALMQPVLQVIDAPMVGLSAALGGLRLNLSSPDNSGKDITWAVLELSGILKVYPTFENGQFKLSIDLTPRVEVIDTPLMPLNENAFEDFLETLLTGLSNGVLNDQVTDAFEFAGVDLFGLSLTDARLNFDSDHPDFLNFAVDIGMR